MMTKKIKQVFFNSWKQVVLNIIGGLGLLYITIAVKSMVWPMADYWETGFPVIFLKEWGPCMDSVSSFCRELNLGGLALDLFFWYVIFCIVVFLLKSIKNKIVTK